MAFCDHNSTPRNRNKCDFRVHFDVLFQDDPDSIPYGKFEYDLPDHSDYYVAEPTATYWPSPLPNPSYPGTWKTLTKGEYEVSAGAERTDTKVSDELTYVDFRESSKMPKKTFPSSSESPFSTEMMSAGTI